MDNILVTILFFCQLTFISETNGFPQLDLPPLKSPKISENLVNNAAHSFTNDGDANEESNDGSQHNYDNDRSQRFGPPYSLDNIEGAPPTFDPRSRSNDRPYGFNNNEQNHPYRPDRLSGYTHEINPNRPDRPIYSDQPDRPQFPDRSNGQNFQPGYSDRQNDRNYPNNFGYDNQRPRVNGDEDKYYRDRNRVNGEQFRPNNDDSRNRYGNPDVGIGGFRPNDNGGVSKIIENFNICYVTVIVFRTYIFLTHHSNCIYCYC